MKSKKIPMRKCVACQEMKPKKELIRVVRTPEQTIQIDVKGKMSGRGAYVCYNRDCLSLLQKKNALNKALETKVVDEVYQQLEAEIERYNEQQSK